MPTHNALPMVTMNCVQCGTQFTVNGAKAKSYKSRSGSVKKYCSPECYNIGRRIEVPTFTCPHCGRIAERRRNTFKDGRLGAFDYTQKFCSKECGYKGRKTPISRAKGYLIQDGYRAIKLPGGKRILEHRLVMERVLGRSLTKEENIHHIDGNRANNNPDNLELWSTSQPCGQRVADKVAWAKQFLAKYEHPSVNANEVFVGLLSMAA